MPPQSLRNCLITVSAKRLNQLSDHLASPPKTLFLADSTLDNIFWKMAMDTELQKSLIQIVKRAVFPCPTWLSMILKNVLLILTSCIYVALDLPFRIERETMLSKLLK